MKWTSLTNVTSFSASASNSTTPLDANLAFDASLLTATDTSSNRASSSFPDELDDSLRLPRNRLLNNLTEAEMDDVIADSENEGEGPLFYIDELEASGESTLLRRVSPTHNCAGSDHEAKPSPRSNKQILPPQDPVIVPQTGTSKLSGSVPTKKPRMIPKLRKTAPAVKDLMEAGLNEEALFHIPDVTLETSSEGFQVSVSERTKSRKPAKSKASTSKVIADTLSDDEMSLKPVPARLKSKVKGKGKKKAQDQAAEFKSTEFVESEDLVDDQVDPVDRISSAAKVASNDKASSAAESGALIGKLALVVDLTGSMSPPRTTTLTKKTKKGVVASSDDDDDFTLETKSHIKAKAVAKPKKSRKSVTAGQEEEPSNVKAKKRSRVDAGESLDDDLRSDAETEVKGSKQVGAKKGRSNKKKKSNAAKEVTLESARDHLSTDAKEGQVDDKGKAEEEPAVESKTADGARLPLAEQNNQSREVRESRRAPSNSEPKPRAVQCVPLRQDEPAPKIEVDKALAARKPKPVEPPAKKLKGLAAICAKTNPGGLANGVKKIGLSKTRVPLHTTIKVVPKKPVLPVKKPVKADDDSEGEKVKDPRDRCGGSSDYEAMDVDD